jgi:3-oxoacyl-[acyl-carrier protein] reductase
METPPRRNSRGRYSSDNPSVICDVPDISAPFGAPVNLGINDRTALVCGGSSGLGQAVATSLAAEGARVAVNGRDPLKLEAAVIEIAAGSGREVKGFVADVSVAEEAPSLVARVSMEMGGVDILLCNAGGPPPGSFSEHSAEAWQQALDLNLLSTINLCRAALPEMRARRWGRIICIASVAAKQPAKGLILSTTARAGLLGFAKSLADEVAADGVTVNVLCPGYIATDRLRFLAEERGKRVGKNVGDMLAENAAGIPMGRIGRPEEFAAAAVFLASEAASYITGTALSVDGGLHRSIL